MDIRHMECCAVQEIYGFEDLPPTITGEEALKYALRTVEEQEYKLVGPRYKYVQRLKPGGFYIFTGVIKSRDGYKLTTPLFSCVDYIRKNKLGVVTESVPRINRRNEPKHLVKVFVWAPSPKNLAKWYKAKMNPEA